MKKRKTITFDQDLILVAHALPPGERGQFYELLIEHFLNGQEFPATLTPTLHLAICTMSPKIRNLQSKFLNGKCTKATLCPSGTSEMKRNEANESEIVDDMLLNKSISNNKISSLINYSINHQNNNYCNNILYKNISSFITLKI